MNFEGLTPLHEAARRGAADACACLLDKGASLLARSGRGGMTPLHLAVSANHEATVRVLLLKGADPDHKADAGSARDIAATLKLTRILQLIEQHEPTGKALSTGSVNVNANAGTNPRPVAAPAGPAAEVPVSTGPSRATYQLNDGDLNALVSALTTDNPDALDGLPPPSLGRPPSMPAPARPPSERPPSLPPQPPPQTLSDTDDCIFFISCCDFVSEECIAMLDGV